MAEIRAVLRRPIITEKTTRLREGNQYVIEVDPSATKGQIREAVQAQFKVTVIQVRTIRVLGKFRRRTGPVGGYQPDRKKAVIELKEGQQIKWEEVA